MKTDPIKQQIVNKLNQLNYKEGDFTPISPKKSAKKKASEKVYDYGSPSDTNKLKNDAGPKRMNSSDNLDAVSQ